MKEKLRHALLSRFTIKTFITMHIVSFFLIELSSKKSPYMYLPQKSEVTVYSFVFWRGHKDHSSDRAPESSQSLKLLERVMFYVYYPLIKANSVITNKAHVFEIENKVVGTNPEYLPKVLWKGIENGSNGN